MAGVEASLYWRLSFFYLFYFASIGIMVPFWSLYLKSINFSALEIGQLSAVLMGTKIIAPYVWAWISDHTGYRMRIVRVASVLSLLCFLGVFFGQQFWWLVAVTFLFSFFWNANLPQFEATTLTHLGEDTHRYSMIRLWGSVGFVIAVLLIGSWLETVGAGRVPILMSYMLLAIAVMSFLTPEVKKHVASHEHISIRSVLRQPVVMALFAVCFLLQASHGPYYAFYTIYLEDNGYSRSLIGFLWALGVLAEILVFLVMHKWLPRFGVRKLMMVALTLSALRWVVMGSFVQHHFVMILIQLLHAASFGVYHSVSIHMIHKYFPGKLQGRGQALYSSLSFGAGGAAGALYSGYVWDSIGPGFAFSSAAGLCVIAWLFAWRYFPRHPQAAI